jgi:hypothetical protein
MLATQGERQHVNDVEDLRNAITAEYEDVRALFRHVRPDDLAKPSADSVPVWRLASEIALAPRADIRSAQRIAAGKRRVPWPSWTPLAAITALRRDRLFRKATRVDFLAAWENSFNQLFACINELAEDPIDDDDIATSGRAAALEHLRASVERRRAKTQSLRQALSTPEPN